MLLEVKGMTLEWALVLDTRNGAEALACAGFRVKNGRNRLYVRFCAYGDRVRAHSGYGSNRRRDCERAETAPSTRAIPLAGWDESDNLCHRPEVLTRSHLD